MAESRSDGSRAVAPASSTLASSTPASAPLLEMQGVSKRFPGVVALDNVSFTVYPAEIVALVGENGAGKSTLMKILGGVYQPDEGALRIAGEPVQIRNVSDSLRLGVGFVHQELNVLDNLDVAANVFLGREPTTGGPLRLIDRAKIHADTDVLLQRVGLNVSSRLPLAALSLAQRQMVEIAKALSQNARILIMDEPTSSLTLGETETLLELTRELRAQGVSVVYISHRLGEIEAIADRVVGLRDGKNAGELAKGEIHHDRMVSLMVGRDLDRSRMAPPLEGAPPVALEVRDLRTLRYPDRAVSFEVRRGEVLGFAGLVGAGRSEVARALFGVDERLGGTFLLEGQPVEIRSPRDAIAAGIYLVPEDRRQCGLVVDMTIRENITLPALRRFSSGGLIQFAEERRSTAEASKSMRVRTPSVEQLAMNLSGGNQQKVVLAKWISLGPKVLIFDEPTRGIDVGAKAEIYDLAQTLSNQGVAIIMISSDMEELLGTCQRIAVMHEGRITGTLRRDEASEEAIMQLAVGRTEGKAGSAVETKATR
jgi:ribose transport system ATP-binding protein